MSRLDNAMVFTPNMSLPVHRWFRYSAGFSAAWVADVIEERERRLGPPNVLDPFVGSGTTLIASQQGGMPSVGLETHSLIARIAGAKLSGWADIVDEFDERGASILASAKPREWPDPPALMMKIYPPETLSALCGLRDAIEADRRGDDVDELLWLALVAILRVCSPVGTAQWQYVLPNKKKASAADPCSAFSTQLAVMASDMRDVGARPDVPTTLLQSDARTVEGVPQGWVDLVVTSPPYPNNYDYADATRIELTFLGDVERWGDLQDAVRSHLMRSCSQHMVRYDAEPILESVELAPIRDELRTVYGRLAEERETHGGKKNYHAMVVAYFHDLARCWHSLRRVCADDSEALFVIGDSAPYGVYLPVDRWLGELALAAGFRSFDFTKLRDRNIKWKNRKHRVPLHEGILRVRG